jgi:hypothetical protein
MEIGRDEIIITDFLKYILKMISNGEELGIHFKNDGEIKTILHLNDSFTFMMKTKFILNNSKFCYLKIADNFEFFIENGMFYVKINDQE